MTNKEPLNTTCLAVPAKSPTFSLASYALLTTRYSLLSLP